MYDIYLGGVGSRKSNWRKKLNLKPDFKVFDPTVSGFDSFDDSERADETARELIHMRNSTLVVFYLNNKWKGLSTLLELADCVGRGKQVVVCLDGEVKGKTKIERYCEFEGVHVVYNIQDLGFFITQYFKQLEICNVV